MCRVPLELEFDLEDGAKENKWDRGKLARAELGGMVKTAFVRDVDNELAAEMPHLEKEFAGAAIDAAWEKVQNIVETAARRHFEVQDDIEKETERSAAQEKRERLLRHRAALIDAALIERDLKVLSKKLRTMNRRQHKERMTGLMTELREAWHRRRFHQTWKIARRMAGTWPGRRWYSIPKSQRCSAQQWEAHLRLPGPEGGMGCRTPPVSPKNRTELPLEAAKHAAAQDYKGMVKEVTKLQLRKSQPMWSLPSAARDLEDAAQA